MNPLNKIAAQANLIAVQGVTKTKSAKTLPNGMENLCEPWGFFLVRRPTFQA
jgi:hypothetical protein